MGLFDKLKGKKETVDWSSAYQATPNFYGKPEGRVFGAIAVTEGTETILPRTPQNQYRVDGKTVSDWRMIFVSTSKDAVIGDADYFMALKRLEKYMLDSNKESILLRGLSLAELEGLK